MPDSRARSYEGPAAAANAAAPRPLPGLPKEVWEQIASHLTAKEWCKAVACQAMHGARLRHLVVHPGGDVNKGLQSLSFSAKKWGSATLLDLRLRLKTKVPQFKVALTAAFERHDGPLSQLTALRLGLEEGSGHLFGLQECQEWLLPCVPNLHMLSLEGKIAAELDSMTSLRHLVLNVRRHPSLPGFIDGAAPCLETLCLQRSGGSGPPCRAVLDFSWLKCLRRLAWCGLDGCKLELPEGCDLYAGQPCDNSWRLYWLRQLVSGFVFRVDFRAYQTTRHSSMLQDLPKLRNIRDLAVMLTFARSFQSLKMGLECFAQARNLTVIRVLASLDSFYLRDVLEIDIPKDLKLSSLVLVAPTVKLGFECALTAAETLADMKLVSAELQCTRMHKGSLECLPYLQDELAPYLKDGLGLQSCEVGEAGGLALRCMYIRRQGEPARSPVCAAAAGNA